MVRVPDGVTASAPRPSGGWDARRPQSLRSIDVRPCPGCDGWLVERGVAYRNTDDGPEPVAVRWGCRTCGCVERTDPDD